MLKDKAKALLTIHAHRVRSKADRLHISLAVGTIGGMILILTGMEAVGVIVQSLIVVVVAFEEETRH